MCNISHELELSSDEEDEIPLKRTKVGLSFQDDTFKFPNYIPLVVSTPQVQNDESNLNGDPRPGPSNISDSPPTASSEPEMMLPSDETTPDDLVRDAWPNELDARRPDTPRPSASDRDRTPANHDHHYNLADLRDFMDWYDRQTDPFPEIPELDASLLDSPEYAEVNPSRSNLSTPQDGLLIGEVFQLTDEEWDNLPSPSTNAEEDPENPERNEE